MKANYYYECKIYLGEIDSESYESISELEIDTFIGRTQEEYIKVIPVRVSKTKFISGTDYTENGWEISAITYPRIRTNKEEVKDFMGILADGLLHEFNQSRICIVDQDEIVMLENSNFISKGTKKDGAV